MPAAPRQDPCRRAWLVTGIEVTPPRDDPEALPPHRELASGGVRYRLGPLVGRGASSIACRATDDWGNRLIAKVYHPRVAAEIWRNEEQMLRRLRHPSVVHLHAAIEADGRGHLLLSDGGLSVGRLRPESPLQRMALLRVTAQGLLQALHHIHAAGCVHADVSPDNVLVERGARPARVVLCDFELYFDVAAPPARLKLSDWSPPPERLDSGRPGVVGPAMDVYAAAMLLLRFLCGAEGTVFGTAAIRAGQPASCAAGLGTAVGHALSSALDPSPGARPSAIELWRLLRPALDGATPCEPLETGR